MIQAGHMSVNRPEIGAGTVPSDDRFDVMIAIAGDEGADDRQLVRMPSEFRECAAEGNAGASGGRFAHAAAR